MRWIVFQATPRGEASYQMYVAPIRWNIAEGMHGHVYLTPLPMEHPTLPTPTEITGIGQMLERLDPL